jgi:hypothetical protein
MLALFCLDYVLATINPTLGANMMGKNRFVALGAERQVRHLDMMMRTSHIPFGF